MPRKNKAEKGGIWLDKAILGTIYYGCSGYTVAPERTTMTTICVVFGGLTVLLIVGMANEVVQMLRAGGRG